MFISTFVDGDGGDPGVHPWLSRPRRTRFAPGIRADMRVELGGAHVKRVAVSRQEYRLTSSHKSVVHPEGFRLGARRDPPAAAAALPTGSSRPSSVRHGFQLAQEGGGSTWRALTTKRFGAGPM